uniref:Uncharacterized protein n=1 Tax=Arundo donax TaxID=35708 RepID=A0A0A9G9G0_ARUDO
METQETCKWATELKHMAASKTQSNTMQTETGGIP